MDQQVTNERNATPQERTAMRRALAQAAKDEMALYRRELIHLHDALYDGPLMATDRPCHPRPVRSLRRGRRTASPGH